MDVERIEHQRVAAPVRRNLLRCGVRQRVGATDHEGVERKSRIKRRAAERLVHGKNRSAVPAHLAGKGNEFARLADRQQCFDRLLIRHDRTEYRGAHCHLHAHNGGILGLPVGKHALGIMRLDPAAQEPCRYRQPDTSRLGQLEFHACEPAIEHVLAEFCAQPLLDPIPAFPISARHFVRLIFVSGKTQGTQRSTVEDTTSAMATMAGYKRTHDEVGIGVLAGERRPRRQRATGGALNRWVSLPLPSSGPYNRESSLPAVRSRCPHRGRAWRAKRSGLTVSGAKLSSSCPPIVIAPTDDGISKYLTGTWNRHLLKDVRHKDSGPDQDADKLGRNDIELALYWTQLSRPQYFMSFHCNLYLRYLRRPKVKVKISWQEQPATLKKARRC